MSLTTVVFDLGGVLIDWDPRYLYRRMLPDEDVEEFLAEIGFTAWNHAQDAGGSSWADAVEAHAARHPHRRDLIEAYPKRFLETLGGPFSDTVAILEELHAQGVPLLALTNWSAETFRVARDRFPFLTLFDGIVVSGEERVAKPDPRIFAVLLARYGLQADQVVFVDDAAANVAAARVAGMSAIHYRGADELRRELLDLGVLGGRAASPPAP